MNTKRIPTVMLLLVVSWLIAIFGLSVAGYLMIYKSSDTKALITAFLILLGALFLSGISRMLGNIGQAFFEFRSVFSEDLRTVIERITAIDQKSREHFKEEFQAMQELIASGKQTQDSLENIRMVGKEQLQCARESAKSQEKALRESGQALSNDLALVSRQTRDTLSKALEEVNLELRAIRESLSNDLALVSRQTRDTLSKALAEINAELRVIHESSQVLSKDMAERLRGLQSNVELIKNALEQSGCDSKDISQNIHQIKGFFEQIEKHLDLKK